MEAEKKHALLSPSAAKRWLHCTPSAVAEAAVPDETSVFAREGSLAHAFCARELLRRLGRDESDAQAEIDELIKDFVIEAQEMKGHADDYADTVMNIYAEECKEGEAEIHIETPLDLGEWAPESFGTADAVVIGPHRLTVIDFKYGRGVQVDARGNHQMRMYALGALDEFGVGRVIEEVRMMIVQPRIGNHSADWMTREELLEWGESYLRPLAGVAARGLGVREAGSWCKFCRVAATCRTLDHHAVLAATIDPDRQDARSLGEVCLPMIGPLEQWIESVRSKALSCLLAGETVPGYKMVRKRGQRKFTDMDSALARLREAGYEDTQILKDPALKGLTDLEKLVGKKKFGEMMDGLLVKTEGEPTVAESTDRRKEMTPAACFDGIEIDV